MLTPELLVVLQSTALAGYVRGEVAGGEWSFPIIETCHVLSLATVYGTIAMVDLRLLGITARSTGMRSLTAEVLPWTWVAFVLAVISGSLMFISKADIYWNNLQARAKFCCLALAGLNMLVFHLGVFRRVAQWDHQLPPPAAARIAGALSLMLWTGVIFFGRWIGFTT